MINKLASNLREECGIARDKLIVVGVSGGPDSLCLMDGLVSLGYPVLAAHFDHQLRPESGQDALVVEALATKLGVRFLVGTEDVRAASERMHQSIEEAARHARYRFLFGLAREHAAQAVAVGHTADDQVETVVMHFLRGSGLSGLRGMQVSTIVREFDASIPVVRPLLDVWREETEAYCRSRGLQPHYDPSNEIMDVLRNRIRHQLLPHLETYNPGIRRVLRRSAAALAEDEKIVEEWIKGVFNECSVHRDECTIEFDPVRLESHSAGVNRHILRYAIHLLDSRVELEFNALVSAAEFIRQINRSRNESRGERKWITLAGGFILACEQDKYYLSSNADNLPKLNWPLVDHDAGTRPLDVPGSLGLPGKWKLSSEHRQIPPELKLAEFHLEDQFTAWLDKDSLTDVLVLRSRRDGDRFQPLGMADGTQKLSDFMINAKLPTRARSDWPLVCMGDLVVWVPGYRIGHPFRLRPESVSAVVLKLEQDPG